MGRIRRAILEAEEVFIRDYLFIQAHPAAKVSSEPMQRRMGSRQASPIFPVTDRLMRRPRITPHARAMSGAKTSAMKIMASSVFGAKRSAAVGVRRDPAINSEFSGTRDSLA